MEPAQTVRESKLYTETEIVIQSDTDTVYRLGSATERWPEILPHYRWVKLIDEEGDRKLVEMAARRNFLIYQWPVRWWAVQTNYPDEPRIAFTHVGGVTKGMEVEWLFANTEDGVRVTITHELDLEWPVIGGFAAKYVIGPLFIHYIASKTLGRIKQLAEARSQVTVGAQS